MGRLARQGVALVLLVTSVVACTRSELADRATTDRGPRPSVPLPPADSVRLTVYVRGGEGSESMLVPVSREVPVRDDLPRAALELLLAGPGSDDPPGLAAPLPPGVEIRSLQVGGGRAHLDLSAEVLTEAVAIGSTAEHELLALAAVANTLTEFPEIERVRLTVEGKATGEVAGHDVAAFWGHWGLPPVLVRDESVIAVGEVPREHEPLVSPERLRSEPQQVGAAAAGAVAVPRLRVQDRICSVRVVVELGDPTTAEAATAGPSGPAPAVPPARVELVGDALLLEVDGVMTAPENLAGDLVVDLARSRYQGVTLDPSTPPGTLRLRVSSAPWVDTPPRAWLHTLAGPTRLVLDLKK